MANNSYYESQGSNYLNDKPSIKKEEPYLPEHDHDGRYYTKKQIENTQKEVDQQFESIKNSIVEQNKIIGNKADTNHEHPDATITKSGFLSAKDKQKLDGLASKAALTNVFAYSTSAQDLPGNTYTKLLFGNEYLDSNDEFTDSTFTAKESGIYQVSGYFEVNNTAAANYRLILLAYKNGTEEVALGTTFNPVGGESGVSGSSAISLVAGESLTFYAWSSHTVKTRARGRQYDRVQITRLW